MFKKIALIVMVVALGTFVFSQLSFGEGTTTNTTQTITTPAKKTAATTVETRTTTTKPAAARPTYDCATLKKMDNTLCTEKFDAKICDDNKNVCRGTVPAGQGDIVYSCVFQKEGPATYAQTPQGPCNLDSAVHRGKADITKAEYKDNPPLKYGSQVECCFRAASGTPTTTMSSTKETIPAAKKK